MVIVVLLITQRKKIGSEIGSQCIIQRTNTHIHTTSPTPTPRLISYTFLCLSCLYRPEWEEIDVEDELLLLLLYEEDVEDELMLLLFDRLPAPRSSRSSRSCDTGVCKITRSPDTPSSPSTPRLPFHRTWVLSTFGTEEVEKRKKMRGR